MARLKPPKSTTTINRLKKLSWDIAHEFDLPPALLEAIANKESMWDPHAKSNANAYGLMQITPITVKEIRQRIPGFKNLTTEALADPETSLRAGAAYYSKLLKMAGGDIRKALSMYNRGPYAKGPMPAETRGYVRDVMNHFQKASSPGYLAPVVRPGTEYQGLEDVSPENFVQMRLNNQEYVKSRPSPASPLEILSSLYK